MSDASEWIVVSAHREFPSTPQFLPVESVMHGSLWRVLRELLPGHSGRGMEPLGSKRDQDDSSLAICLPRQPKC